MDNVKNRILTIFALVAFLLNPISADAVDTLSLDDFSCVVSEAQPNTIDVLVSRDVAERLLSQGFTSIRARLYSNDGISQSTTPSILSSNTDFVFRFPNLKNQKYNCYLAGISNDVQGLWSDSNEIRLGEIPKCRLGYTFLPLLSFDGKRVLSPTETCRPIPWTYENFNDGFDKYFSITMQPIYNEDGLEEIGPEVQIFCDKKKLEIYVWAEYADGFGWLGSGQMKFDSGGSKKFNYRIQKDFDGIVLKDAKGFISNLLKSKNTFGFKIPNVDGYVTATYAKGNLLDFRNTFTKAGCKF